MKLLFLLLTTLAFAIEIPKTFCASFKETITSKNSQLHYKGKVVYKDKEMVWKYLKPEKKIIWIKDRVYIYEPDLMQVTIKKKDKLNLNTILKNAKKVGKNLYKTKVNSTTIYFVYDKTLKKLYYTDEVGNDIAIDFKKDKCDFSLLKVKYPKDVDIIYQR